ncbi:hypothetical protein ASPSYDRAFT_541022 [Aspergillus sydowii CBS 593.65]|uniref:Uncharacterized protein n=1 Tax=Aspergillus sydowii CBS 593.65 TaxID=1036612 RepID=A0A1L9T0V6_9EURO|nr:uncharacterized protein ASPSYDRAFT_541022 [Aspergillus sydowii CBS 593.65]OJJ53080.1 hypothetical protein ASPSYDRAFT_541022 [Aspergillus sydowii CBS 593.65]
MGQSQSTCSKVDSSFLDFCQIKTGSSCQSKKTWYLSSSDSTSEPCIYFDTLLDDYHLALTPTHSPVHTRPRVDIILHLLLAQAKRKVLERLGSETEAAKSLGTLFWGYEQSIAVPGSWSDGNNVRECVTDYVLWYGDQTELKTNLVVLRAEEPIESCEEYLPTLAAISMIQRNREDGLVKETYGIYTDGFKWIFMHLNRKYKYCSLELDWSESRQVIIGQISKILDKSVSIRLSCGGPDSEAIENWSVWNVKPRDISDEDAEWLRCDGKPLPEIKTFKSVKTNWLHDVEVRARLESTMKTFFDRYKLSTAAKAMIRELIDIARVRGHNQESDYEADSCQPSTLSLSDIRAEDVDCVFGLERGKQDDEAWNLDCSEKHDVPEYLFKHPPTYLACLSQALEDYNLAFGRARQNESLIRVRVNTIMLAALAGQKRDGFYKYQQEKGPDNYLNVNSIRWGVENEITVPWLYKSKRWLIRGTIEHVLWYGSQKRMEGNTVVVVKGLSHPSIGLHEAMSYMAILKRLRREAGCATMTIYGIATDSYDWYFIRLCPLDTISYKWVYFYDGDQAEFVSRLRKFLYHAAGLGQTQVPAPVNTVNQNGIEKASTLL